MSFLVGPSKLLWWRGACVTYYTLAQTLIRDARSRREALASIAAAGLRRIVHELLTKGRISAWHLCTIETIQRTSLSLYHVTIAQKLLSKESASIKSTGSHEDAREGIQAAPRTNLNASWYRKHHAHLQQ